MEEVYQEVILCPKNSLKQKVDNQEEEEESTSKPIQDNIFDFGTIEIPAPEEPQPTHESFEEAQLKPTKEQVPQQPNPRDYYTFFSSKRGEKGLYFYLELLWSSAWLFVKVITFIGLIVSLHQPLIIQLNLTVWSYYIACLYLVSSIVYTIKPPETQNWRYHLHRYLHIISYVNEVVVTIGYWPFAFEHDLPYMEERCAYVALCHISNTITHGFGMIPAWTALIFQKVDIRKKDLSVLALFGCVYSLVLVSYTLLVKPIYGTLTFKKWLDYIFFLLIWVSGMLIFFVGFWIQNYKKRRREK